MYTASVFLLLRNRQVSRFGYFHGCGTIGTLLVTLGWDARHTNVTVGGASADSGTWLVDAAANRRVSVVWWNYESDSRHASYMPTGTI